jgi:hypothetical protein
MPQIIVTAGDNTDVKRAITLRERINASDFESDRFATNLIERIAWAVSDAADAEERGPAPRPSGDEPTTGLQAPRELVEV